MIAPTERRLRVVPQEGAEAGSKARGGARLVERARARDTRAWARLYQGCFPGLMRHVTFMVVDVNVAEDLCQETFAVAFANIDRFDPQALPDLAVDQAFAAWVRGIAQNLVRKHWRKRERQGRAFARLEVVVDRSAPARTQVETLERERQADALAAALEQLPPNLREAFILSDLRGLGASEAAAALGISAGNFRVRASRARSRLRELLTRAGAMEPTDAGKGGER
ncbi:hypothetical protein PPSIR1_25701 [Plesiocystis pacifica SIR-1]|uniref:Uncharacterized protein n=1 Tax=Plesiocystis pacifica SIR-1 TaxID=391625 RepID=A6FZF4_9BACT|nr:RNA polymerase sigma factor [Plesiocystis pacifica]EDM81038.1 hypothetical protein PPSIR1_25701 [Plesiocystis pacifica SIR-1]